MPSNRLLSSLFLLLTCGGVSVCCGDDRNAAVAGVVKEFVQPGMIELPIGVTPRGTYVWCVVHSEALLPRDGLRRVVIASGVDGDPRTVDALLAERQSPALQRDVHDEYARAWIPIANPDAWYDCVFGDAEVRPLNFPPNGTAFNTPGEVEAAILCRFAEWFAPDAIVEITPPDDPDLEASRSQNKVTWRTDCYAGNANGWDAAGRVDVAATRIPADLLKRDQALWTAIERSYTGIDRIEPANCRASPTAKAATVRLARAPEEVVNALLDHYGQELKTVMYQPALALVARLENAKQYNAPTHQELVGRILDPYLSGERSTLDAKSNGSRFAGHLVFSAWAEQTADERAVALIQQAAERAFDAEGYPREAMPTHNEMSDAVFMACPILTSAGRFTGDAKYIEMARRHLAFMQKKCLRDDGLYRHSPLCEAPWGRGNGFPALGLALCLTDLQVLFGARDDAELADAIERVDRQMLMSYRAHLQALLPHQDATGMWRQVIDHPGSYRELTSTCMITFAMARGLRMGWLDGPTFRPAVDRAWEAIKLRVYDDGVLIDVCTGTGKQKTLQDYLNRTAILDRDERGGAMALMAAMEMARLLKNESVKQEH